MRVFVFGGLSMAVFFHLAICGCICQLCGYTSFGGCRKFGYDNSNGNNGDDTLKYTLL